MCALYTSEPQVAAELVAAPGYAATASSNSLMKCDKPPRDTRPGAAFRGRVRSAGNA